MNFFNAVAILHGVRTLSAGIISKHSIKNLHLTSGIITPKLVVDLGVNWFFGGHYPPVVPFGKLPGFVGLVGVFDTGPLGGAIGAPFDPDPGLTVGPFPPNSGTYPHSVFNPPPDPHHLNNHI